MDHLGKTVHNGEEDRVLTRKWETSNNIHCYVGPGTTGNRQGSEEASGRMIRRLAPCTRHTGHHKLTQVPRLTGPPEVLTKELQRSLRGWNKPSLISFFKKKECIQMYLIPSPSSPVLLGLSWLLLHNPLIDWTTASISNIDVSKGLVTRFTQLA